MLVLLWRVFDGFVRKPVERPMHRWVIVPDGQQAEERPTPGDNAADDATRPAR